MTSRFSSRIRTNSPSGVFELELGGFESMLLLVVSRKLSFSQWAFSASCDVTPRELLISFRFPPVVFGVAAFLLALPVHFHPEGIRD